MYLLLFFLVNKYKNKINNYNKTTTFFLVLKTQRLEIAINNNKLRITFMFMVIL